MLHHFPTISLDFRKYFSIPLSQSDCLKFPLSLFYVNGAKRAEPYFFHIIGLIACLVFIPLTDSIAGSLLIAQHRIAKEVS